MPFKIIRADITTLNVDAIVNAANTDLKRGGGVCGAIFKSAGSTRLQEACDPLAPIETGDAVITLGFDLPAKHIIHTAGPVYKDGQSGAEELLRAAYRNSMQLAVDHNLESIAFPLISSGIYGYPKQEALDVALSEIQDFLATNDLNVTLVVFDKEAFRLSKTLRSEIESYISEHLVDLEFIRHECRLRSAEAKQLYDTQHASIDKAVFKLDESFAATLFRMIDSKGMTDVDVYKRANIDRKLFSKIRNIKTYTPSKRTALALAIALNLTLAETNDLLNRAGYALSKSQLLDVIVAFFIENERYDLFEINNVLFDYDQPLLGA